VPNHCWSLVLQRLRLALGEAPALPSVVRQDGVVFPQRLLQPGLIRWAVGVCWRACGLRKLRAILPKWFLPTRLETRTKESNIYASVLVEKPTRVMKVSDAKRKQQHQPTMILW
jgi:hypothetical protein